MAQVIVKSAISFVRTLGVDLLNLFCQLLILLRSAAALTRGPFVVGRNGLHAAACRLPLWEKPTSLWYSAMAR